MSVVWRPVEGLSAPAGLLGVTPQRRVFAIAVHDDDSVYAYFGAGALATQTFERFVLLALEMRGHRQNIDRILSVSPEEILAAESALSRKTMGQLYRTFRDGFDFPKQDSLQFSEAVRARNRLMHGYFARNALRLQSAQGRAAMSNELDCEKELFWQAAKRMGRYVTAEGEALIEQRCKEP
ncbi:hypothetical protein [Pseudooceanicola nanhaiensis]|uniref:hypothetical protein n=1 Tax=Pseudooceanicola nanhaiensis TaxID=375761 RepID=UPI001CD77DEB|nr:hypothetical protein [Pseudooceanicola nanhaiensis]MCA0922318.1 hypothetical protein [Pseudooceanicola nanhaiensis]